MEKFDDKNFLREKYKKIRKSVINKEQKSTIIYEKILNNDFYKNSQVIAIYNSFFDEVDTLKIIQKTIELGKDVVIPKTYSNNTMDFYKISDLNDLVRNNFGIKEPIGIEENLISKEKINLFIVPGICFDKKGNRVGFGKGYYDKYLENTIAPKIGICFDEQVTTDNIRTNKYDIKMDLVITDKQYIE